MIDDIPIFYLCSRDKASEWWWGFTGEQSRVHGRNPRSHVYFTEEFLRELTERHCWDVAGFWELSSAPGVLDKRLKTFEGWVIKWTPPHMSGYVWRLTHRDGENGYVLGVWPD